jgi:hypothetical protein
MTRLIPYLLYLLLVGLHQVILKDVTMIYNATINLPAFLVLAIAIYKSEWRSRPFTIDSDSIWIRCIHG